MVKVKTSAYFRQIITVLIISILFAVGLGLVLHSWWSSVIVIVFLAFYHKEINRSCYLIMDKYKKSFETGTFVFCGDLDKIKRSADRSKDIKEGRISSARMTLNNYEFRKASDENAPVIKMTLYITDSINYKLILSKILKNADHKFTITYGKKSGVITEIRA